MKLYKVNIAYRYDHRSSFTFFVVAPDVTNAEKIASDTFKKYDYGDFHIHNIELIAAEGQYSKPDILVIEGEIK